MAPRLGESGGPAPRALQVAPSPHLSEAWYHTRGMMIDVLVGLVPVMAMAIFVFRWHAVVQVGLCTLACVATEAILFRIEGKAFADRATIRRRSPA